MKYIYVMILALLFPFFLRAQEDADSIIFYNTSVEEGLSSDNTAAIVQDSIGFIWIGTINGGVSRYDGTDFTNYLNDPHDPNSLPINYAWRFYTDPDGNLWIVTWGGGLSRYDPHNDNFQSFRNNEEDGTTLSSDFVWSALIDRDGDLWVGTERGLNLLDARTGGFRHYRAEKEKPGKLTHDNVSMIIEGDSGLIWLGTYGGGLNRFDKTREHFKAFRSDPANPSTLDNDLIWAMMKDSEGYLWIGTEGGLNRFDPETESFERFLPDPFDPKSLSGPSVTSILQDSRGRIWIGTNGYGVSLYNRESNDFNVFKSDPDDPYSLSDDTVWDIYEDKTGTIWFATFNGIERYDSLYRRFHTYKYSSIPGEGLSSDSIQSISGDRNGEIWLGTRGGGLNRFDPEKGTYRYYLHDPEKPDTIGDNTVLDIEHSDDGLIWLGTGAGVDILDIGTDKFEHITHITGRDDTIGHGTAWDIARDGSDTIWFGLFGGGLNSYDLNSKEVKRYLNDSTDPSSLVSSWITVVTIDSYGFIWAGTEAGISRLDRETGKFTNFLAEPGRAGALQDPNIHTIYEDESKTIWIGTSMGLHRFNREEDSFTLITGENGNSGNMVASIQSDEEGKLWLGTNRGLLRFDPETGSFRNFNTGDGLPGNQFRRKAAYRDENGRLYFGSIKGLVAFYPEDIIDNPVPPPLVLTDFRVFNESLDIGRDSPLQRQICHTNSITLPADYSVFSIHFSALNFLRSSKNRYAYIMEGVDKDWIHVDSNRRFASYTNLDPGTYHFRVKGSNNDGVWNDEGLKLEVTILPHWWESWWALTLYGAAGLLLILLYVKLRTDTLRRTKRELEMLVDTMPSVIMNVSAEGTIIHLNDRAAKHIGLTSQQIIGQKISKFFPRTFEDLSLLHECIGKRESMKVEKKPYKTDKGMRFIDITILPFAVQGSPTSALVVIDDVTTRIKMEQMMIQNEKMLSLGGMAAGMAHEINNPLAGVIQTVSVLNNRLWDHSGRDANNSAAEEAGTTMAAIKKFLEIRGIYRMLESIHYSGRRVTAIIDNMLSFARTGEGKKSGCSLNEVIERSLELARSDYNLEKKHDFLNIRIEKQLADDLPPILCEKAKIEQVLLNILRNGAQAMMDSESEIKKFTIQTFKDDKKSMTCLRIEDTGPGMSEQVRNRIFEPFFTTKEEGSGTGLGLSISYFIITEDHKGEMEVESDPGQGATFIIRFPSL